MEKLEFELENKYLNKTLSVLDANIKLVDVLYNKLESGIKKENDAYLSQMRYMNLNEMSEETAVTLSQDQSRLDILSDEYKEAMKNREIFRKMKNSPYFARIDYVPNDTNRKEEYYIGVHSLTEPETNKYVVLDWRSPLAGLFYDYDAGSAEIKIDDKTLPCKLLNKRQYKIENGELKYFFDTNIAIDDEMLQESLAKSSSVKMKSIVQTIQKEQNNAIRRNENENLLVLGVAGSGKTAVALHRIAYLLYKLKGKIKSENIVLLSPNSAFSSYISQVLPDLSEEDIKKIQFDDILTNELKKFALIEPKYLQMERVITNENELRDFTYKTSFDYLKKLLDFCKSNIDDKFNCYDLELAGVKIEPQKINNLFHNTYKDYSIFERICLISEIIVNENFYDVKSSIKLNKLKKTVFTKLFELIETKNCVNLYNHFLNSLNLSLQLNGKMLKNEDAYPMLYLRQYIWGPSVTFKDIKHLVIDEMQDYSPIQLYIIGKIFNCSKTLLGDYKQSLNLKNIDENIKIISFALNSQMNYINLKTSYRPTEQIAKLFKYVGNIDAGKIVSRSGDKISVVKINSKDAVSLLIKNLEKLKNNYGSVALITKTIKEAKYLYEKLKKHISNLRLIDDNKDELNGGIVITSVYNSKGLEFDAVLIYNASANNYKSEYDNNLLYIALSRALHKIIITYANKINLKLLEYFKNEKGE